MKKIAFMFSSVCTVAALFSGNAYAAAQGPLASELINCKGQFALCSNINCVANPGGKTAVCKCDMYDAKNVGTTTCAERDTAAATGKPYSEYAPIHYMGDKKAAYPEQLCTGKANETLQYADCWNIQGTLEGKPGNEAVGKKATFVCPIIKVSGDKGFWMQAATCKEGANLCASTAKEGNKIVINGAGVAAGAEVMNTAMQYTAGRSLQATDFCAPKDAAAAKIS